MGEMGLEGGCWWVSENPVLRSILVKAFQTGEVCLLTWIFCSVTHMCLVLATLNAVDGSIAADFVGMHLHHEMAMLFHQRASLFSHLPALVFTVWTHFSMYSKKYQWLQL